MKFVSEVQQKINIFFTSILHHFYIYYSLLIKIHLYLLNCFSQDVPSQRV